MQVCKCVAVCKCASVLQVGWKCAVLDRITSSRHLPLGLNFEWKNNAAVKVELSIVVEKFTGKLPIKPRVTIKLLAASARNEPFTTFTTAVKTAPVARQPAG